MQFSSVLNRRNRRKLLIASFSVATSVFGEQLAKAGTPDTFSGGSSSSFANGSNWSAGIPVAGDDLLFPTAATPWYADGNYTVSSLSLGASAFATTLGSSATTPTTARYTLTFGTLSTSSTTTGSFVFGSAAYGTVVASTPLASGNGLFDIENASMTVSAGVVGLGDVTKTGSGVLNLGTSATRTTIAGTLYVTSGTVNNVATQSTIGGVSVSGGSYVLGSGNIFETIGSRGVIMSGGTFTVGTSTAFSGNRMLGGITLTGGTFTLGNGDGIVFSSNNGITVYGGTLSSSGSITTANLSISSGAAFVIGDGASINAGNLNFSGISLTTSGNTTLNSAGLNLTGGTAILGGALNLTSGDIVVGGGASIATSGLTLSAGNLVLTNSTLSSSTTSLSTGSISLSGSNFTVGSATTLAAGGLYANNSTLTTSGSFVANNGVTLSNSSASINANVSISGSQGVIVSNGSTLSINSGTFSLAAGGITVSGSTLTSGGGVSVYYGTGQGLYIGNGGLFLETGGFLGLGVNPITTTIAAGTLEIAYTPATLNSARFFELDDAASTIQIDSTYVVNTTTTLTGSGSLTKTGGGTLQLRAGAALPSGSITASAGTLQLAGNIASVGLAIINAATVSSYGATTLTSGGISETSGTLALSSALVLTSGNVTVGGGNATFGGKTTLTAGRLSVSGGTVAATSTFLTNGLSVGGGNVQFASTSSLTEGSGITVSGGTLEVDSSITGSGTASSYESLVINGGTYFANGTNDGSAYDTYTKVTLGSGTLRYGAGNFTAHVNHTSIQLALTSSSSEIDVDGGASAYVPFGGGIIGSGSLNKGGTGTFIVSPVSSTYGSSFLGSTNITQGTLFVANAASSINPLGAGGVSTALGTTFGGSGYYASSTTISAGATLATSLEARLSPAVAGGLTLTGAHGLTMGSNSTFNVKAEGSGAKNDSFVVSSGTLVFGDGSGTDNPTINIVLSGDANASGSYSATDQIVIYRFSSAVTGVNSGFYKADGTTANAQFVVTSALQTLNYSNASVGFDSTNNDIYVLGVSGTVPEPASLGVLGLSAMGMLARRRRKFAETATA